ncbi:MAG: glycosyltransferase [Planctomycetota bacterium]
MSEALDKARALLEQGDRSEAQDACRACLNAADVTPTDLLDLAERALQCDDARLAGELLKAVIQDDPAEPLAWLGLARSCMQMGIPSKAAGMLGRCLQNAGDRTDVLTPAAAVLAEMGQSDSAAELLKKSLSLDPDQPDARAALEKLSPTADTSGQSSTGPAGRNGRIAVFCGPDGDTFLKHIIEHLRRSYDVRVFSGRTLDKQNERECLDLIQWCDVAWVEWATNLAAAITHITPQPPCRVVVRLHKYEAYTPWPTKINWGRVDTLINVGNPVVLDQLRSVVPDIDWKVNHVTLPNGVDMDRYSLSAGERTKEMVFIGNLRPVKNPQFLLQCMHRLRQEDPDYRLHVAGHWDDRQLKQYLLDASRAMDLQEHLLFEGFQKDIDQWLADKSVIVSSSLIESQGMGIMEGMARGLKPIIHRFPGAEHIYHEDHLFLTPEEFAAKVLSDEWDPARYRREIEENYSLALQLDRIDALMTSLCPAGQRAETSPPAGRSDVPAEPSPRSDAGRAARAARPAPHPKPAELPSGTYRRTSSSPSANSATGEFRNDNPLKLWLAPDEMVQPYMNLDYFLARALAQGEIFPREQLVDWLQFYYHSTVGAYFNSLQVPGPHRQVMLRIAELLRRDHGVDLLLDEGSDASLLLSIHRALREHLPDVGDQQSIHIAGYGDRQEDGQDPVVDSVYRNLAEAFAPLHDSGLLSLFVVHGSFATMDYTPFSDIDTQLFLTDSVFEDAGRLQSVARFIAQKNALLRSFDPIQHHGYFITLDVDRRCYPQSFLPVATLERSRSVFGQADFPLQPRILKYADQYSTWHTGYFFRACDLASQRPTKPFDQKRFLSRFSMLPLFDLELADDTYPYKGDVWTDWKRFFGEPKPELFGRITTARAQWNPQRGACFGPAFYRGVREYAEHVLSKLRKVSPCRI